MRNAIYSILLILLIVGCNTEKKEYLDSFEKFIVRVEKNCDSYSEQDWIENDELLSSLLIQGKKFLGRSENESFNKKISDYKVRYEELRKKHNTDTPLYINFYLDNSLSIDGYINEKINSNKFIGAIGDVLGGCKRLSNSSLVLNLINDQTIKVNKNVSEFKRMITKQGLTGYGNRNKSDLNGVFSGALDKVNDNSVSIMVSDGIYSMSTKGQSILTQLNNASGDTRDSLFIRLQDNPNIETVVIKLTADFIGEYFSESKQELVPFPWNERPYYIWFFGTTNNINKVLESIEIRNTEGYKETAHYYVIDNRDAMYSITNIGKNGYDKLEPAGFQLKKQISVKASNRQNSKGNFSFSVAVDLKNLPLGSKYKEDKNNYKAKSFNVDSVIPVSDKLIFKDPSLKHIIEKKSFHPTHLIFLSTNKVSTDKIEIKLENNELGWIEKSSNPDDTNPDNKTTFGFEYLMTGISEAYSKVNDNKNYLSLKIEIKN
jgi:hypothetical protein